jgi:hypothetical protein
VGTGIFEIVKLSSLLLCGPSATEAGASAGESVPVVVLGGGGFGVAIGTRGKPGKASRRAVRTS